MLISTIRRTMLSYGLARAHIFQHNYAIGLFVIIDFVRTILRSGCCWSRVLTRERARIDESVMLR